MLLKLHIKDFALIDDLEIDFKGGLNILTGETGAGKSIIIDAVNMIIGERASSEYIRTGKQSAMVEAVFDCDGEALGDLLKEYGIEAEDGLIIITREITEQGRNFCRANGRSVPVSVLKKLGRYLIDIHGQHQHQSLLESNTHMELLDLLGGEEVLTAREDVARIYELSRTFAGRVEDLVKKREELRRHKDILKYEIDEIEKAHLTPGEDVELEEKRRVLENAGKIFAALELAYSLLYLGDEAPSIIDNLGKIISHLEEIKKYFKPVESLSETLKNMLYELQDVAAAIRNYKESVEFDPEMLNEIQSRLELLDRLKAKYNMSIDELLKYKEEAAARLDDVLNIDDEIAELEEELKITNKSLVEKALALHNLRKKTAARLERDISKELQDLGMKGIQFAVNFKWEEDDSGLEVNGRRYKITRDGFDRVEFLISTNPGEPLKPLAKIVSGGEASRIMLALKNIMAKVDNIPCLIFDEIDAGIGGRTAQIVGEKLSRIAKSHQVLCVTHSPQIASLGDAHFLIKKETLGGKTYTRVSEIRGQDRVNELARMLGGAEITGNTLAHAREMLKLADNIKNAR
jgi:DNA repair protein RecN (Recombination protein N)